MRAPCWNIMCPRATVATLVRDKHVHTVVLYIADYEQTRPNNLYADDDIYIARTDICVEIWPLNSWLRDAYEEVKRTKRPDTFGLNINKRRKNTYPTVLEFAAVFANLASNLA